MQACLSCNFQNNQMRVRDDHDTWKLQDNLFEKVQVEYKLL